MVGTIFGGTLAIYEFNEAANLNTAAGAQEAGGLSLISDPNEARFNYVMGWANLILAGVDFGLTLRAGQTAVRGLRVAERSVSTADGAKAFARLNYEQIGLLDEAIALERSGDLRGARGILKKLKREVGDETLIDDAYEALKSTSIDRSLFKNIPEAEIPQYEELIDTDFEKGKRLLDEFGTFENFENFQRVFNALDRTNLDRMVALFSDSYQSKLSRKMQGRYNSLLQEITDGTLDESVSSLQDRLEVLTNVSSMRDQLAEAAGTLNLSRRKLYNLGAYRRNIAYGRFTATKNGVTISEDFVVMSGKKTSTLLEEIKEGADVNFLNERTVIPDISENIGDHRFGINPSLQEQAWDSERKFIEYSLVRMEEGFEIGKLNPLQSYEGRGFQIYIEIYSGLEPCDACSRLMKAQYKTMFGKDVDINIKFGLEFETQP